MKTGTFENTNGTWQLAEFKSCSRYLTYMFEKKKPASVAAFLSSKEITIQFDYNSIYCSVIYPTFYYIFLQITFPRP